MGFALLKVESTWGWLTWCLVKVMYCLAHEISDQSMSNSQGAVTFSGKDSQMHIWEYAPVSMSLRRLSKMYFLFILLEQQDGRWLLHHLVWVSLPIRWWNSWVPSHAPIRIRSNCAEINETSAVPGGARKTWRPQHQSTGCQCSLQAK